MRLPLQKVVVVLLGLLLGFVFINLSFQGVEFDEVKSVLITQTQFLYVMVALLFYSLFFVLKTYRWQMLLRSGNSIAFSRLISYVILAYTGSILLPMQLGEVYRAAALKRYHGNPLSFTFTGIAIEKALDVGVIVLFCLFTVALSAMTINTAKDSLLIVGVAFIGVLMTLMMVYRLLPVLLKIQFKATHHGNWQTSLLTLISHVQKAFRIVKNQAVGLALHSILMWLMMAISLYFVMLAVGLAVSWWVVFIVLFYSAVGLMLPTAPGFIGTIQGVFVLALLPLGFEQSEVLAAAILYNVMITVFPLLLAIIASLYLSITQGYLQLK